MENFNWTEFTIKIAIKASIREMYDAWAIAEKIETWFLSDTVYTRPDGSILPKNEPFSSGDWYEWHWFLFDGVENGKILDANGKDFIQFQFANSIVEVKLTEQDEFTIVSITQKNIPTDDQSKRNIRLGCEKGWTFYLLNLKTVYENGVVQRNKDEGLRGMVNN